jgi:cobaltochelatase CobN
VHLLRTEGGRIDDGAEAVDLGQSPGDIVVLSAADSEIACLSAAQSALLRAAANGEAPPTLRLANLMRLGHPYSIDLHVERVIARARLVVVRLLGGRGYWPYGVERIAASSVPVAFLPGDDQPDPELAELSSVPAPALHRLWQYLVQGGLDNATEFLRFAAHLTGRAAGWREPAPLPRAGLYWPGLARPTLDDVRARWIAGRPVAALVFYRALVQSANTEPVDALIDALARHGLDALPVHVAGLKDPLAAETLTHLIAEARPALALNATGFAVGKPGAARAVTPFDAIPGPVLQIIFAGSTEAGWQDGARGLGPSDIAMNVALPEIDGRILGRAVAFKGRARRDPATETEIVGHRPRADRVEFVAALAANWAGLAATPRATRRVALVLANYPNRDGRIGNGVGLDTPASTIEILRALRDAGYATGTAPPDADALMAALTTGPTNGDPGRAAREHLSLAAYRAFLDRLPGDLAARVTARWGAPEDRKSVV